MVAGLNYRTGVELIEDVRSRRPFLMKGDIVCETPSANGSFREWPVFGATFPRAKHNSYLSNFYELIIANLKNLRNQILKKQ